MFHSCNRSCFALCFYIVCIVYFNSPTSQSVSVDASEELPFDENKAIEVIEQSLRCHNNPGLAVSVVKDGKVLLSRGFGVSNRETNVPVTSSTVFGIASLSKAFASTLLVKLLYQNSKLTVDSKVRELLEEEFQMADEFRTQEATFVDLMAHKMAVPSNNQIRFDSNLTRETLVKRIHLLPAPDQFRVKYYYSNLVYGLVTRLAEYIAGGQKWEDLVTEHLFEPLGMRNSTFATTADFSREDIAVPYIETDDGELIKLNTEFSRRWAELAGSGAVMTTADDMVKWMNFHLYGDSKVMDDKHLAEVHKPRFLVTSSLETRTPQFPVTATQRMYALGFRAGFYRGYETLVHSGSTLGYRAYMTLLPDQKIGVFTAMTGRDDGYKHRIALQNYLVDAALGVEPWLNETTVCSYPEPWKSVPPSTSTPPSFETNVALRYDNTAYEGLYHNPAYGYMHVTHNASLGVLELQYGWGTWQLYWQSKTTEAEKFFAKGTGISHAYDLSTVYMFSNESGVSDGKGGIKSLTLSLSSPPVFDKVGNNNSAGVQARCSVVLLLLISLISLLI